MKCVWLARAASCDPRAERAQRARRGDRSSRRSLTLLAAASEASHGLARPPMARPGLTHSFGLPTVFEENVDGLIAWLMLGVDVPHYVRVLAWVCFGCVNGVGFVVKCIGIHIESSDSTTNPSHSIQNSTPNTHPYNMARDHLGGPFSTKFHISRSDSQPIACRSPSVLWIPGVCCRQTSEDAK